MKTENNLFHLSIFLIKESISDIDKIINNVKYLDKIEVPISGHENGKLYIRNRFSTIPKWFKLFVEVIDNQKIGNISNISAAFLLKASNRYFVLSFGSGGRFILNDDSYEERFGLIVALNTLDKNGFRCIDKQTFDSIQSHTRIQSIKETNAYQFGLDVEQDILRAIVGIPHDETLGSRMIGTESLSVNVKTNLLNLPFLLESYKNRFEDESYKADYPWVNNISEIKKTSPILEELDSLLIQKIKTDNPTNFWLSIPEIIQWDLVLGFIFSSGRKIVHPDHSCPK